MCERKTILVRGDSRRMMGIRAVTALSTSSVLEVGRGQERSRTLGIVDDTDIQLPQRRILSRPKLFVVVFGPRLEELLVLLAETDFGVGDALEHVLRAKIVSMGSPEDRETEKAKGRTWNLRLVTLKTAESP